MTAGWWARNIAAVTVTSQRQGVVFLDRDGRVLYAGPNVDLRAIFEGAAIDDAMGSRVFEVTGRLPSFLFAPAKLRWFMQNKPDVYERIDRVVDIGGLAAVEAVGRARERGHAGG